MIAASELDRLSSAGAAPIIPTGIAGTILDPQHDLLQSPAVPLKLEQRRRAARRSRLSEVTTPEDLAIPESARHQLHRPPDADGFDEPANNELRRLIPQPLKISRNGKNEQSVAAPWVTQSAPVSYSMSPPSIIEGPTKPTQLDSAPRNIDPVEGDYMSQDPTLGARPRFGKTTSSNAPVKISVPRLVASIPIRTEPGSVTTKSTSANGSSADIAAVTDQCSKPCHPDQWPETRGKPGDSDPLCPPECGSRHSHEVAEPSRRPSWLVRQTSSGTVLVMEPVSSSGSEAAQSMRDKSS